MLLVLHCKKLLEETMKNAKFVGCLIAVSDMAKARHFYEKVLGLKITDDWEEMAAFEGGFTILPDFGKFIGGKWAARPTGLKLEMKHRPDNFSLYFEVDDLARVSAKIKSAEGIEILIDNIEYDWGQRFIRFYDHDKYIVEIAEDSSVTIKRLLEQGLNMEQIAKRFEMSVEHLQKLLNA
jgi:catechol 2,3-dioxygenase-like lactoylglutathione lyase family enzyme